MTFDDQRFTASRRQGTSNGQADDPSADDDRVYDIR